MGVNFLELSSQSQKSTIRNSIYRSGVLEFQEKLRGQVLTDYLLRRRCTSMNAAEKFSCCLTVGVSVQNFNCYKRIRMAHERTVMDVRDTAFMLTVLALLTRYPLTTRATVVLPSSVQNRKFLSTSEDYGVRLQGMGT